MVSISMASKADKTHMVDGTIVQVYPLVRCEVHLTGREFQFALEVNGSSIIVDEIWWAS